jgi:hypothetical protein
MNTEHSQKRMQETRRRDFIKTNDNTQQNRTDEALASSAFCTNSLTIEIPSAGSDKQSGESAGISWKWNQVRQREPTIDKRTVSLQNFPDTNCQVYLLTKVLVK